MNRFVNAVALLALSLLGTALVRADVVPSEPKTPMKPPVRLLPDAPGQSFGQGTEEFTSREAFVKRFGEKAAADVDFEREKVLWVTWTGSGSSFFNYRVEMNEGGMKVEFNVKTPNPATTDLRHKGALLVMPKQASWEWAAVPTLEIRAL
jgi:hypothetical protein